MTTQEKLKDACAILNAMGYVASFEHPGHIALCGYAFGYEAAAFGGDDVFCYNAVNCVDDGMCNETLPSAVPVTRLVTWIHEIIHKHEANPRFVLNIGAISEVYPDMPVQYKSGTTELWDRQEKKPVITIHSEYAQAICLQLNCDPTSQPFETMERWFNLLGNDALISESIAPSKPVYTLMPAL